MWWPFGKTMKYKCRDGTWREVYKNIDDVYPLIAKEWFTRWDATVKALEEVQGGLGMELKKQIGGFFVQLNEISGSMQIKLRAAYSTYKISPCESDGWLRDRVQEIIEEESALQRAKLEINKVESLKSEGVDEQALKQTITKALATLSKSDIEEERSRAFQNVEKDMLAWRGGV